MASAVREHFDADLGLAVGEFPVLRSGEEHPQEFWLALATPHHVESKTQRFAGHPDILLERSAKQALDLLRLRLLNE